MRPRIRKTLVALTAAFGMTVAFAGAASAAKPAPAPTCPSGDTTVVVTFDRAGNPVNNDPTVTVTGDSTAGTVTTDGSVLITGYARVVNRKANDFVTLADPVAETSYDNAGFVNKRGKALDLKELDICTTAVTVTPPPTSSGSLTFSCHPATYADRNWEFQWSMVGGSVDHVVVVNYTDDQTGLVDSIATPLSAGDTGVSIFEQANVGDTVRISVLVDDVAQSDLAYDGLVATDMACGTSSVVVPLT